MCVNRFVLTVRALDGVSVMKMSNAALREDSSFEKYDHIVFHYEDS